MPEVTEWLAVRVTPVELAWTTIALFASYYQQRVLRRRIRWARRVRADSRGDAASREVVAEHLERAWVLMAVHTLFLAIGVLNLLTVNPVREAYWVQEVSAAGLCIGILLLLGISWRADHHHRAFARYVVTRPQASAQAVRSMATRVEE